MIPPSDNPLTELTVLSHAPLVAGIPLGSLDGGITPTGRHFIRNHFPIPRLGISNWSLTVGGEVERPLALNFDDLRGLARKELIALLECAGNSRATVQPPVEGLLWDHGGVGAARWTGVPLRIILELAGLRDTAREVLLEGADRGEEWGNSGGEMSYAMSLPLEKALHPDTLLAYEMNGEALSPEHGYPLRVMAPGWYGMTSVKWLVSIQVLQRPFEGYHQTVYYVFDPEGAADGSPKERVTSLRLKSLIIWPTRGLALPPGSHSICGVAWSGQGPVSRVEVTTDNGRSWCPAEVEGSLSSYAWQQWKFAWNVDQPGFYLIRARATDDHGNVQPVQAPWNFRGFANNSVHVVPVEIRPQR